MRAARAAVLCGFSFAILFGSHAARAEEGCSGEQFNSTFEAIQKVVFERHQCTNPVCHGAAPNLYQNGKLDLRADAAYDNLVDVKSESVSGYTRVLAGDKTKSLLWLNLAGKTEPEDWEAPLRAMPPGEDKLTADELELVRLWIEKGAPKNGVLAGTEKLIDACLPPPEPVVVKPLPPPTPGTGIQIKMPPYMLNPGETEVCYASYYDITDQVPAEFRSPDGKGFRYKFSAVRQTPMSHHLIVNLYSGAAAPNDPSWGAFTCNGGPTPGSPCNPVDAHACGDDGFCATTPVKSIACTGFGPGDSGVGLASRGFSGTQETATETDYPAGIYGELPLKGMILWNSHSFNLTADPGKIEAWINFEFAAPQEQVTPIRGIFDAKDIFAMDVPPFSTEELCSIHTLPKGAHLYELSSHAHRHMKRWRTFRGAFRCQGGPAAGQACSPVGYDNDSPDPCDGAPCSATKRTHVGDCDVSGDVTVDEVISGVNIALGVAEPDRCWEADSNEDSQITVDEVVTSVNAALNGVPAPTLRDPDDSLMYVSVIYNDPLVLELDPPLVMRSADDDERSLTYCGLYDNGFSDPEIVKKQSTSPAPPIGVPGVGGPCTQPTHCTTGKVGELCSGRGTTARNRSCDSATGSGDGLCDACPLRGGVTTEDEMFILMGQFYVP